jgi:hypothetical protein
MARNEKQARYMQIKLPQDVYEVYSAYKRELEAEMHKELSHSTVFTRLLGERFVDQLKGAHRGN